MSTVPPKYRPRNNVAPPGPLKLAIPINPVDSRPQQRHRLFLACQAKLIKLYRRGMRENHQWPIEMPRRTRRKLVRNMAKQAVADYGLEGAARYVG